MDLVICSQNLLFNIWREILRRETRGLVQSDKSMKIAIHHEKIELFHGR